MYRSNSFSCRSSPRRFYAVRRLDSQQDMKEEEEEDTTMESVVKKHSKMKNILLSNFQSPQSKKIEEDGAIEENFQLPRQQKTRRNIFSDRTFSGTSCTDTISFHSSEIACLSPAKESACKRLCLSASDDKEHQYNNKSMPSENTLDWLSEIEQNESEAVKTPSLNLSFHEALNKISQQTPDSEDSPKILKKQFDIHHDSIKQSPTIVRAGNQAITVSPLLSASSIELLESAPILSPVSHKKSKKRRILKQEYL